MMDLRSTASVHDNSSVVNYEREVLEGLTASEKYIAPKFFYDEKGSELFTEITHQPEYYLTRTETGLLKTHTGEISALIGDESLLIEYGSGSSFKTRILLECLRPRVYAPLDISRAYLFEAAAKVASEYPWLDVRPTCVDFTSEFDLPFESNNRRVGFFPGSSIGNFEPGEAIEFLRRARRLVGDSGVILLGVDLKKDIEILNNAYNDAAGVTRQFNLNILQHLNNVHRASFNLERFQHQAYFNSKLGCIQMFLVSEIDHIVEVAGKSIMFKKGESIHTENSFKYKISEVEALARAGGFNEIISWTDDSDLFGLFCLASNP